MQVWQCLDQAFFHSFIMFAPLRMPVSVWFNVYVTVCVNLNCLQEYVRDDMTDILVSYFNIGLLLSDKG